MSSSLIKTNDNETWLNTVLDAFESGGKYLAASLVLSHSDNIANLVSEISKNTICLGMQEVCNLAQENPYYFLYGASLAIIPLVGVVLCNDRIKESILGNIKTLPIAVLGAYLLRNYPLHSALSSFAIGFTKVISEKIGQNKADLVFRRLFCEEAKKVWELKQEIKTLKEQLKRIKNDL